MSNIKYSCVGLVFSFSASTITLLQSNVVSQTLTWMEVIGIRVCTLQHIRLITKIKSHGIGVGTGGAPGACVPPCFINCYINCSLLYV